jgi:type II secretory pathway pseudopilin PulG
MRTHTRAARHAFTLVEVLVSASLIAYLMIILFSTTDAASRAWRDGHARTDAFQNGRTTLELLAREITPAVVDTRMQFVIGPGEMLSRAGAPDVAPESPTALWMAPLGEEGDLRCVGYYLQRDTARKFYRLKRLIVGPLGKDNRPTPYFPQVASAQDPDAPDRLIDPRNVQNRTSPVNADWFTRGWDADAFDEESQQNDKAIVSTVADGVIAFWVQPYDILGRTVPRVSEAADHPKSNLFFNSAAYFQMPTAISEEIPRTIYQAASPQTMKANRVPQAVEITIVTLDRESLQKANDVPQQTNELDAYGALDVEASLKVLQEKLQTARIPNSRTFTNRARLINGN